MITVPVTGQWIDAAGRLRKGSYKVSLPVALADSEHDVRIPSGLYASGDLAITDAVATSDDLSLQVDIPATDAEENGATGWQVSVVVSFADGANAERYVIPVPQDSGGINLADVVLTATIPAPQPVLIKGIAGGIASLDASGKVPDDQLPDDLGGGTTLTSYADQVQTLDDYPASFPPDLSGVSPSDIGAQPAGDYATSAALVSGLAAIPDSADDVGAVPTTRTVNGKPLSADVTIGISDIAGLQHDLDAKLATVSYADLPAGATLTVLKDGDTWAARPTDRADVMVIWKGPDPSPDIVESGTGGMLDGVDERHVVQP